MKHIIIALALILNASVLQAEEAMIAVEPLDSSSVEKREALLTKIEEYLNSFDNFSAKFEQYSAGHPFAKGDFKLKKPYKFLWQYQEPETHKIIATGTDIYFVDDANGQVTQLPRHPLLEELLLKKEINLKNTEKLQILNITENDDSIDLFLKMQNEEEAMQLALNFSKAPFQLREILTTNQLGHKVYLSFKQVDTQTELANKLFKYRPPQYQDEDEIW